MSTGIANGYGMGHPGLECAKLKRAARDLADENDPGALVAAADRPIELPQESVFLPAPR